MIAWVLTPQGEGALVDFVVTNDDSIWAIVVIDKRFCPIRLSDIEWHRWPD